MKLLRIETETFLRAAPILGAQFSEAKLRRPHRELNSGLTRDRGMY